MLEVEDVLLVLVRYQFLFYINVYVVLQMVNLGDL